jgi:hypothetical protein
MLVTPTAVEIYVLQSLNEVTLEGLPADGLQLHHDLTISPNRGEVMRLIDTPFDERLQTIRRIIGEIEREAFNTAGVSVLVVQHSREDVTDEEARRFLLRVEALLSLFLLCLWLVRDNSANGGQGVIALGYPYVGTMRAIFTQRPGLTNFTARCDKRTEAFSRAEIDQATRYFELLEQFVVPQVEWRLDAPRPTGLVFASRLFRMIYFTEAARGMADVGVRAMYYSMALESLLAGGSGRLSHNTPKRASIMLGRTKRERQRPYNDIYALYGYRSDVVHGAHFDPGMLAEVRATTERCDDHLRRIITSVLEDPALLALFKDGSDADISRHFNEEPREELPERARTSGKPN